MDILLIIIGIITVVLLIFLIILVLRKSFTDKPSFDVKSFEERLIRMEGEVNKINPAIDKNFRDNRKEISENLERMQNVNAKIWSFYVVVTKKN